MGIFDLSLIGFAAFLFICALIKGCTRGGIRAFLRLLIVAGCAVLAYTGAQTVMDTALNTDVTEFAIPDVINGTGVISGTLNDYIAAYLSTIDVYNTVASSSPYITALVAALPAALLAVVFMLAGFILLKLVSLIVYAILKLFVPNYTKKKVADKHGRTKIKKVKRKRNGFMGFLFSLAQAAVVFAFFMIPTFGLLDFADQAITAVYDSAIVQDDAETKAIVDEVKTVLDEAKGGMVYGLAESTGLRKKAVDAFDSIYVMTDPNSEDGKQISLMKELKGLLPIAGQALDLASLADKFSGASTSLTAEDMDSIAVLLRSVGESELITGIVSDVLSNAATKWAAGEEFLGIAFTEESGMDPILAEGMQEVMKSLSTADSESLKKDLEVLSDVVDLVGKYGIMDTVSAEMAKGEGGDLVGALITAISSEVQDAESGESSAFVEELFNKLGESEHFSTLVPVAVNIALQTVSETLGVPKDKEAAYDRMMEDVSETLNNEELQNIDYSTVDTEIETKASAPQVYAVNRVYAVSYLGETYATEYDKYVALYGGIVSAMQKAGLAIASSDHIYTTGGGIDYIFVNDNWMKYSDYVDSLDTAAKAAAAEKKAAALAMASMVSAVKDAKDTTAESVKTLLTEATAAIADESVKAALNSVTNVEAFKEESTVTTFQDMKLDVSNFKAEDMATIGSVAKDLAGVAGSILTADLSTTDGMMNAVAGMDFAALGGALNKLDSIGGKEKLGVTILEAVANTEIGQDPTIGNILTNVTDGLKSGETDFAKIGDSLGAVAKLTKYISADTDFTKLSADEWADCFYTLHDVAVNDKGTFKIVENTVNDLISTVITGTEMNADDMKNLISTLLDVITDLNYQTKDDAKKDGEAIVAMVNLVVSLSKGGAVIETEGKTDAEIVEEARKLVNQYIDSILVSDLVCKIFTRVLSDFAKTVKDGKQYLFIEDITLAKLCGSDTDSVGAEMVYAVLDVFVAMGDDNYNNFAADMRLVSDIVFDLAYENYTDTYVKADATTSEGLTALLTNAKLKNADGTTGMYLSDKLISLFGDEGDEKAYSQIFDGVLNVLNSVTHAAE